jgi:hypothetical protein
MQLKKIQDFYNFGYSLQFDADFVRAILDSAESSGGNEIEPNPFEEAIKKGLFGYKGQELIVPLSGGLDSRLILFALINLGYRDKIHAITFGEPGTWDFELGKRVARKKNVKHTAITISDVDWDLRKIKDEIRLRDEPFWFVDYFLNYLARSIAPNGLVFSGFMGDPTAGSHLLPYKSPTPEAALTNFLRRSWSGADKFTLDNEVIIEKTERLLPQVKNLGASSLLTWDEICDFGIRQAYLIRPIVAPETEQQVICPFLEEKWLKFSLSQPYENRYRVKWYYKFCVETHSDFFDVPVKADLNGDRGGILGNVNSVMRRINNRFGKFDKNENYLQLRKPVAFYPKLASVCSRYSNLDVHHATMRASVDLFLSACSR